MDLTLSEEQQLVAETVRRFVEDQILPLERTYSDGPLPDSLRSELIAKVRDMGFWASAAPSSLGGGDLGAVGHGVLLMETGRSIIEGCLGTSEIFGGNPPEPLLSAGADLTQRLVQPIVDGTRSVAYAPPQANNKTTVQYRLDGDSVVLDGRQSLVEGWTRADALLLLANGDSGLVFVVVDKATPGLTEVETLGQLSGTSSDVATVELSGVRVPRANLVGEPGDGAAQNEAWVAREGLRTCCRLIGMVERGSKMARDYAKQRITFGAPLSSRQAIQWKLVDTEMDLYASRWMVLESLANADAGKLDTTQAATARLYVLNAVWKNIDEILQVFGGIGFTADMPIESMWRHIRVQQGRFGSLDATRQEIGAALGA